jgi:hypothetical protein
MQENSIFFFTIWRAFFNERKKSKREKELRRDPTEPSESQIYLKQNPFILGNTKKGNVLRRRVLRGRPS